MLSFASYHLLFSLTSPVSYLPYSNTPENKDVLIEVYQEQHDTGVMCADLSTGNPSGNTIHIMQGL